jgi:hypothetical protein
MNPEEQVVPFEASVGMDSTMRTVTIRVVHASDYERLLADRDQLARENKLLREQRGAGSA